MEKFIEFFIENKVLIVSTLLGLAELVVRLYPTEKNRSLLVMFVRLIDILIPNIQKEGKKKILLILFLCLSVTAFGQLNNKLKIAKFSPVTNDTTASASHNGFLWYDFTMQHFRYTSGGVNKTLLGTGNISIIVTELGSWNMVADAGKTYSFTDLEAENIVEISVTIIRDDDAFANDFVTYDLDRWCSACVSPKPGGIIIASDDSLNGDLDVAVTRYTDGGFDATDFNKTTINRGFLTIIYRTN